MKKILFLIGKPIGLEALQILKKRKNISIDVFTSDKKLVKKNKIKFIKSKEKFINYLRSSDENYDFLILVYWPWLVPKELFKKFDNSINFHPSFLPIGRGWYPHVHAIVKNLKIGVTLHKILPGIDNGDIWCQEQFKYKEFTSASDLYKLSQLKILKLFKKNIFKIISGKLKTRKQSGISKIFKKQDVNKYDKLYLNKTYKLKDLINLLNARKFEDKSFNYFNFKNQKYILDLKVKKV
jgi:methionyl-tRNA formyltransferase